MDQNGIVMPHLMLELTDGLQERLALDVTYPYNTGNEGWVYNDNVNYPKIKKWLGEVVGKEGEDLTRHDKWLCMMYPRLKLLQKLLADDGVIFIRMMGLWGKESTYTKLLQRISEKNAEGLELHRQSLQLGKL